MNQDEYNTDIYIKCVLLQCRTLLESLDFMEIKDTIRAIDRYIKNEADLTFVLYMIQNIANELTLHPDDYIDIVSILLLIIDRIKTEPQKIFIIIWQKIKPKQPESTTKRIDNNIGA